jgi:hypothetical protein
MNALTRARCSLLGLFVKRLNPPFELDHQRVAFAVYLVADGYLDPAFADAVLGDVVRSLSLKRMPMSCSKMALTKCGLRSSVERWSGSAGRSAVLVSSVMVSRKN